MHLSDKLYCNRIRYAPFCKHIFIPNFTDLRASTVKITDKNKSMIVTDYEQRTPKELPVLVCVL